MPRYRVRQGTRVVVYGEAYSNGETFPAGSEDAAPLLAAGYVTEVDGKAVHAESVEDKATPRKRTPRKRS